MPSGTEILLVEDEEDFRDIISGVLGREGYLVSAAANGEEGLESFSRRRPRLVLLDLHLPDLDGEEVCRRMRALDPGVPVLVCSVCSDLEPVARCLASGAAGYIVKPFEIPELLRRVSSVLEAVPPGGGEAAP